MKISRSSILGIQDQVHDDSNLFFQSNEASALESIAPIYFSIYSIKLELHVESV
jgi:hypothetical protein